MKFFYTTVSLVAVLTLFVVNPSLAASKMPATAKIVKTAAVKDMKKMLTADKIKSAKKMTMPKGKIHGMKNDMTDMMDEMGDTDMNAHSKKMNDMKKMKETKQDMERNMRTKEMKTMKKGVMKKMDKTMTNVSDDIMEDDADMQAMKKDMAKMKKMKDTKKMKADAAKVAAARKKSETAPTTPEMPAKSGMGMMK